MTKVKRTMGFLQVLIILTAVICLVVVAKESNQSVLSVPIQQEFMGEYSQDGGEWTPLEPKTSISSYEGDVVLRGHFSYEVPEGARLNFYLNHIGFSFFINGELYMLNAVMENGLNPSVCSRNWGYIISPGLTAEDEIVIHLHNPHTFGNKNAFQDFLATMCNTLDSSEILEQYLKPYCLPFKLSGLALLIISFLLLGAAAASFVLKSPVSGKIEKIGLLTFFAGGYLLLDTLDCFYEDGLLVLRTCGHQICMMFFALWFGFCLLDILDGKRKKAAGFAVLISAAADMVFLVLSFIGVTVIYDTELYWCALQVMLCIFYLGMIVWEFVYASRRRRILLALVMLLCGSMLLDLSGVGRNIYSQGTCTKAVFMCLTLLGILRAVKGIIMDHQTSIRMKAMEKELEESRISIMLSQIQPHFLYNVLNTIFHLCEKDAGVAQQAISDFSDYLRMNLKSLDRKTPVSFSKELKHVKTYLNLEKLRFDEELNIRYEIGVTDFELPALTIQPLVENAVKHGICPKEGGGTVTIRTDETADAYIVTVKDDGVGFDTGSIGDDGKCHIGIENVRCRLQAMCRATLVIESTPGKGTTATIRVTKEAADDADYCGRG